jgi:hydroxymethylglutaryl-CoA lyase
VTISVVWGCPFDGEVPAEAVTALVRRSVAAGAFEVALGDTIGVAVPAAVTERVAAVRAVAGDVPVRVHFHDTRNTGIANVYAALLAGVTIVDASVGGAGGCPFARDATGNVATEDVLYMLHRSRIETGIDMDAMGNIGRWLGGRLKRTLPSAIGRAGGFPSV